MCDICNICPRFSAKVLHISPTRYVYIMCKKHAYSTHIGMLLDIYRVSDMCPIALILTSVTVDEGKQVHTSYI